MQFDDFEALDDVANTQNDEFDDSQFGDQSARSLKKPPESAGLGMDAFADFAAGGQDYDDDQSSVLTEDILERRRFQEGEEGHEGEEEEDEDFDGDDIWKSYIPDMAAEQETAKASKNSKNVLNNFYAGAQQNFLFDNYMLDDDRKSQDTPARRPSASKSAESLKLSGEREEDITHGDNISKDNIVKEANQKQEIQKNPSLGNIAAEEQRKSVQRKPQNLEELVMQAVQESHHDIPSADLKSAGQNGIQNQSPLNQNKIEEEDIHVEEVEPERNVAQEKPRTSEEKVNKAHVEPESGGFNEDAFRSHIETESAGIGEDAFKSFVDLGDGESQDDSKYEGSFISENELGSQQEIADDSKPHSKQWLNLEDNDNLMDSSQIDLDKSAKGQQEYQQMPSQKLSSQNESIEQPGSSSQVEVEVPKREQNQQFEARNEYVEQQYGNNYQQEQGRYGQFEEQGQKPFDEDEEEQQHAGFSKQVSVNRNAAVEVQQSNREEETRGEEDMWKSHQYGESLGNSYQPNLQSASIQGRFGKPDFNLTSVTNDYSIEREEEYYHEEITPAQRVNQGINQMTASQKQVHQNANQYGSAWEEANETNQYANQRMQSQNNQNQVVRANTQNQEYKEVDFWEDITSPGAAATNQPASHPAQPDLKDMTRQISAISAGSSPGQAQNDRYQRDDQAQNIQQIPQIPEHGRSISATEANQNVQQRVPSQLVKNQSMGPQAVYETQQNQTVASRTMSTSQNQPGTQNTVENISQYRRPSASREIQNDSVYSEMRPEAPVTQPEFVRNVPIKAEARRVTEDLNSSVNQQVPHAQKKPVQLTLESTRPISYVHTPPAKKPVQLSMESTQGVSYVHTPPAKKPVQLSMQATQGVSYVQVAPPKKPVNLTMQALQGVSYVQIVPEKKPVKLSMESTRGVAFMPPVVEKKAVEVVHSTQAVQTTEPVVIEATQRNDNVEEVRRVIPETKRAQDKFSTPIRSSAAKDAHKYNSLTPRRIGDTDKSINIKCSIHQSEYIEKICTDPKYPKKRMLCWECAVDETKEMTKYRYATQSITQYATQKVQEYYEAERVAGVPEELKTSLRGLKAAEENFSGDISESVSTIQESLKQMKTEILAKFDELDESLREVASQKTRKFGANRDFFESALIEHFNKNQKEPIPYDDLINQLVEVETERDFEDFINSLKSEINITTPEIKSYIKVLANKVTDLTRETNLPNKALFKELKSKNLKVSQLYEQLQINLSTIKMTVYELLDTSYSVKDISKTRVVSTNTVTPDNMNVTIPLNKISDDILKYRLRFEKKLVEPEAKSITCVSVIDNEILAAGTLEQTITLWSLATGECLESIIAHDDIISGLYPFKVSHADLNDRKPHTSSSQSDSATLLISTGGKFDNTILFWDISWTYDYLRGRITEKQQSRLVRRLEGHNASITSVLPVLDGVTLINGTYDGKICVWNVLKNRLGGEIKQHQSSISSLKMLHCRRRFASASWDKTICIWKIFYKQVYDAETRIQSDRKIFEGCELEKVIDPSFKVQCLGASIVNKNWLAFGGEMNRLVIWDIEAGKLVKEFECDKDNLVEMVLVEDQNSNKMIVLGVCDDDDAIRAWDTNYKESDEVLDEVYNLKSRDKIYINKANAHGPVLQLVQDGVIKIAAVNSAKSKNCVSLLEVELGV